MGKNKTPRPDESNWQWGCLVWLVINFAIIAFFLFQGILAFQQVRSVGILLLIIAGFAGVPLILVIVFWAKGKLLLTAAQQKCKSERLFGILATSDSPNWKDYIEQNWIAKFGGHFITVNCSEYGSWKGSLEARIYSHYLGEPEDSYSRNFCPAIILFRGLRRPLLYRFYYAFRDAKHGNRAALEELERHLDLELEKRKASDNSDFIDVG
jgi:hypothetical protein